MTDEQMKSIDEWMEWQRGERSFHDFDIRAAFQAIRELRKEYEEQKGRMVRFANDSEAYRQGQRDELEAIIAKVDDMRDDARREEENGPDEGTVGWHMSKARHYELREVLDFLLARRKE